MRVCAGVLQLIGEVVLMMESGSGRVNVETPCKVSMSLRPRVHLKYECTCELFNELNEWVRTTPSSHDPD
jgi:hypothetical protein